MSWELHTSTEILKAHALCDCVHSFVLVSVCVCSDYRQNALCVCNWVVLFVSVTLIVMHVSEVVPMFAPSLFRPHQS
jgi:hypothetical protein